ncbi:MAG: hypothetical protein Q4F49_01905 [Pseudoxanthomonas suwonensis]|nr:hypothetical protein [Pseudoxanthomonas suwonensis]
MNGRALPPVLLLALCMACSRAPAVAEESGVGAVGSEPAAGGSHGTAVAAELMIERLVAGENHLRKDYDDALEICAAAGWPIEALTPAQVELLGKRRVEVAIDGKRRLVRGTEWATQRPTEGIGTLCLFTFTESVHEYYDGPDRSVYSVHEDGTVQRQEQPPEDVWPEAGEAVDEDLTVAEAIGWQRDGEGNVAGQPCTWWRRQTVPGLRICMWNAAKVPGFSQLPSDVCNVDVGVFNDRLPLAQEPADGASCRIRTVRLVTGTQVPGSAFSLKQ